MGDTPELPANSHRSREPEPVRPRTPIEPIAEGVLKKPGVIGRFKSVFFAETMDSVIHYVVGEVILPSLRDMFIDAVTSGTKRAVRGGAEPRRRTQGYSQEGSRTVYSRPTRREPRDNMGPRYSPASNDRTSTGSVIVPTREQADRIVDTLIEVLSIEHVVTTHLLYELAGLADQADHTDFKFGWSNLNTVVIRQVRGGWLIDMPPEEAIG